MLTKELTCLEIILRHIINETDLDSEIFSEFTSTKTFANKKGNLFNLMVINKILENYQENPPFPVDSFVYDGIIPNQYDNPTTIPAMDPGSSIDPTSFIKNLVAALREENYLFDEENNIYISSNNLETLIPQTWLYRLSEAYKRNSFSKLYFYNKNEESDISDKISLIDYLRHTKTFLVSLSSKTNTDYDIEFAKAEALTNNEIKDNSIVRVEDLIKIFRSKISKEYNASIERYKLTDLFFIVNKAEKEGQDFYSKSLTEQKKIINEWILEFINSNDKSKENAQEYLLLLSSNNEPQLDKKEVISGLINLFLDLLSKLEIEYSEISLTDLKINTYIPKDLQTGLVDKKTLVQAINRLRNERESIKRDLDVQNGILDGLKVGDREFSQTKENIQELIEEYRKIDQSIKDYQGTYNYLQEKIRTRQKDSILDISFANDEIIKLLIESAKNGRIYLSNNNSIVNFEIYNTEIGKTTFKASITTLDLLTLIENINYYLQDNNKTINY